jgi:hypothetical protein
MKARDHDKIMRESITAMRRRHSAELESIREQRVASELNTQRFFAGEIADRERIMDNYAKTIDRYDVEVETLIKMLRELGVDADEIDRRLGDAVKVWIYGDCEVQP